MKPVITLLLALVCSQALANPFPRQPSDETRHRILTMRRMHNVEAQRMAEEARARQDAENQQAAAQSQGSAQEFQQPWVACPPAGCPQQLNNYQY